MKIEDRRKIKGFRDPRMWAAIRTTEAGGVMYFNGIETVNGEDGISWIGDINTQGGWLFNSPEEAINYFTLLEQDGTKLFTFGGIELVALDRCEYCRKFRISPNQQEPPAGHIICPDCRARIAEEKRWNEEQKTATKLSKNDTKT